jgi:hypothetical protein
LKRLSTWVAIVLALVVAFLSAAWVGRDRLLAPHLKAMIREILQEEAGLEVAIDSLSGSYLRDIEILGLETVAPSAGPLSTLAVQRIHLRYRLPTLLQGLDRFLATASIAVEFPRLEIDLDRWEEPLAEAEEDDRAAVLPAMLPRVHVTDGELTLFSKQQVVRFEGVALTLATEPRLSAALTASRMEAGQRPPPEADFVPALAGVVQILVEAPGRRRARTWWWSAWRSSLRAATASTTHRFMRRRPPTCRTAGYASTGSSFPPAVAGSA